MTRSGALVADRRIRIDCTAAVDHGVYFDGDPGNIEVYPASEVSRDPTVPPGVSMLSYSPHEDLPHETVLEMTIDPRDETTPPGMNLGCQDETTFEQSPGEILFERTDSGATISAPPEVAGPVPGTFIVQSEVGDPLEDVVVLINGHEGTTGGRARSPSHWFPWIATTGRRRMATTIPPASSKSSLCPYPGRSYRRRRIRNSTTIRL